MKKAKKIPQQPKREKRLDHYDLPPGFTATRATELKKDQFFFFHMTGKRQRVEEINKGVLVIIKATAMAGV